MWISIDTVDIFRYLLILTFVGMFTSVAICR